MKDYSNSQIQTMIDEYIHSERDRQILVDRLINGMTFAELGDKYFLCERQLKRIVKKLDVILLKLI